jgi:hypothetical protein
MASTTLEKMFIKRGKRQFPTNSIPMTRPRTTNMMMERPRPSSDSLVQTATIQSWRLRGDNVHNHFRLWPPLIEIQRTQRMILWLICKINICQLVSTAKLGDYQILLLIGSNPDILEVTNRITLYSP